jgi:hypothetical protein
MREQENTMTTPTTQRNTLTVARELADELALLVPGQISKETRDVLTQNKPQYERIMRDIAAHFDNPATADRAHELYAVVTEVMEHITRLTNNEGNAQ